MTWIWHTSTPKFWIYLPFLSWTLIGKTNFYKKLSTSKNLKANFIFTNVQGDIFCCPTLFGIKHAYHKKAALEASSAEATHQTFCWTVAAIAGDCHRTSSLTFLERLLLTVHEKKLMEAEWQVATEVYWSLKSEILFVCFPGW